MNEIFYQNQNKTPESQLKHQKTKNIKDQRGTVKQAQLVTKN